MLKPPLALVSCCQLTHLLAGQNDCVGRARKKDIFSSNGRAYCRGKLSTLCICHGAHPDHQHLPSEAFYAHALSQDLHLQHMPA